MISLRVHNKCCIPKHLFKDSVSSHQVAFVAAPGFDLVWSGSASRASQPVHGNFGSMP